MYATGKYLLCYCPRLLITLRFIKNAPFFQFGHGFGRHLARCRWVRFVPTTAALVRTSTRSSAVWLPRLQSAVHGSKTWSLVSCSRTGCADKHQRGTGEEHEVSSAFMSLCFAEGCTKHIRISYVLGCLTQEGPCYMYLFVWMPVAVFPKVRTLESPVITLCTTSWTFSNSPFCPHSVFMCFVWIWEQTAIISLCNINWLVFITETECVYCAVRTGSLYIIQVMCGSENKRRLFPYTPLTDWFL